MVEIDHSTDIKLEFKALTHSLESPSTIIFWEKKEDKSKKKREREKSGEKIFLVGVWLKGEVEKNFGRTQVFSPLSHQKVLSKINKIK